MEWTLLFLALLMAVVVWWLVRQTVNVEPWVAGASVEDVESDGIRSMAANIGGALRPSKVALGVFLAVVTSIFALFISAYSIRMEVGDWRPLPEPALLWANTGILVLCSVFLQGAWVAVKRNNVQGVKLGMTLSFLMTVAFMVGQLMAWDQLIDSGYVISGNPANAFFYTLTAVHALHLIGGLVVLMIAILRVWSAEEIVAKVASPVELCGVYWHFLLAVWIILFSFLLNT
jgi:cytochrome c oxidase subunit 3